MSGTDTPWTFDAFRPVDVDADLFRLVYGAASTEATRYYLNGVHVEPLAAGGVIMVATDGHRIYAAFDPSGYTPRPFIVQVSPAFLKQCKPGARSEGTRLKVPAPDGGWHPDRLPSGNVSAECHEVAGADGFLKTVSPKCLVDGVYPDWRRVVPRPIKAVSTAIPCFNARYLSDLSTVAAALAVRRQSSTGAWAIAWNDAEAPALVTFPNSEHEFFAVLMPMRNPVDSNEAPGWRDAIRAGSAPLSGSSSPEAA